MFEDSLFLALPVAVLAVGALVVLFLAFPEAYAEFRAPFVPVQVQGNERIALTFDGPGQAIQLVTMQ